MDEGITVTGLGESNAPADVVRINVGVQCDGPDVASALRDAGQRLAAVSKAARDQGVRATDIQSSSVTLFPRYGSDGMAIVGYQASHEVEVTSHEIDRAADLIAAFAEAAGNALTINAILLSLNDPGPVAAQARGRVCLCKGKGAAVCAALRSRARRRCVGGREHRAVAGLGRRCPHGTNETHEQRRRRHGSRGRRNHCSRHSHGPVVARRQRGEAPRVKGHGRRDPGRGAQDEAPRVR